MTQTHAGVHSAALAVVASVGLLLSGVSPAAAQAIGTFRWQQQPYCNVITVNVVQSGVVYQLDGYDDQCGAGTRAAAAGLAFLNPDGSIGFGLTIVTSPGGAPVHVDAAIALATLSGTWRDSSGVSGPWTFLAGPGLGGSPRPAPRASFPGGISAGNQRITDLALAPYTPTDAVNKGYVDSVTTSARAYAREVAVMPVIVTAYSATVSGNPVTPTTRGCVTFAPVGGTTLRLNLPLPVGATLTTVRLRYRDTSVLDRLTMNVREVEFDATGSDVVVRTALTQTSPPTNGASVVYMPELSTVTQTRSYYVEVTGPAHTGELSFCGAQVDYTLLQQQ